MALFSIFICVFFAKHSTHDVFSVNDFRLAHVAPEKQLYDLCSFLSRTRKRYVSVYLVSHLNYTANFCYVEIFRAEVEEGLEARRNVVREVSDFAERVCALMRHERRKKKLIRTLVSNVVQFCRKRMTHAVCKLP